jgi:Cu-Zn family superoxide dismutase
MKKHLFGTILLFVASFSAADEYQTAAGKFVNAKGETIGVASLIEGKEGVYITFAVQGLSPGLKGFHIHEKGSCTPPDFGSAGGHLNPYKREHGFKNLKGPHAGDLRNITIRDDGTMASVRLATQVTLKPGKKNSLLDEDGSAIVIHEKEDDYMTNPAGNAGSRIACAVIKDVK